MLTDIAPDPELANANAAAPAQQPPTAEVASHLARAEPELQQQHVSKATQGPRTPHCRGGARARSCPTSAPRRFCSPANHAGNPRQLGDLVRTSVEHALKQQLALPASVADTGTSNEPRQADGMNERVTRQRQRNRSSRKASSRPAIESHGTRSGSAAVTSAPAPRCPTRTTTASCCRRRT